MNMKLAKWAVVSIVALNSAFAAASVIRCEGSNALQWIELRIRHEPETLRCEKLDLAFVGYSAHGFTVKKIGVGVDKETGNYEYRISGSYRQDGAKPYYEMEFVDGTIHLNVGDPAHARWVWKYSHERCTSWSFPPCTELFTKLKPREEIPLNCTILAK